MFCTSPQKGFGAGQTRCTIVQVSGFEGSDIARRPIASANEKLADCPGLNTVSGASSSSSAPQKPDEEMVRTSNVPPQNHLGLTGS